MVIVAISVLRVQRAAHRRRLAAARLELARVVLEMDRLMSTGKIRLGHCTHDHLYPVMLRSQACDRWTVPWRFWRRSSEYTRRWTEIEKEVKQQPVVNELLARFRRAAWSAFMNDRPILSLVFVAWVMSCLGGLLLLVRAILASFSFAEGCRKLRLKVVDYFASAVVAGSNVHANGAHPQYT